MWTIIVLTLIVCYILWASLLNISLIKREEKLNDRITILEITNKNNKTIIDNYNKLTMWQKNLIKQEIARLKLKYNLYEIGVKLKTSKLIINKLNDTENLDIKKNDANKYIKKLKNIT
jgi:hypothetical protein